MGAVRYVVLYDADCGFCRWTVGQLLRWDRRRALNPLEIQSADGDRLLAPVPEGARLESWHLVDDDGCVYSSGAAFPPLLRALPGGVPLAGLVSRFPATADRAYRWVARNRSLISRAVPRRAKAAADKRIETRQRLAREDSLPAATQRC